MVELKNLNEAKNKEDLPLSFITNFVSQGWDNIGELKQEIEAIHKEFKGTKKIETLIQALIDAYLVCIGQLEQHIKDKDYLDIPEELKPIVEENKDNKKDLKEDIDVNIDKVIVSEPKINLKRDCDRKCESECIDCTDENTEDTVKIPEVKSYIKPVIDNNPIDVNTSNDKEIDPNDYFNCF